MDLSIWIAVIVAVAGIITTFITSWVVNKSKSSKQLINHLHYLNQIVMQFDKEKEGEKEEAKENENTGGLPEEQDEIPGTE